MDSLKDNNSEVYYNIFRRKRSYSTREDRKWIRLTPDSFSNKAGYNEVP